ncbi:MAG TPA: sugar ABC transporter permease [Candidatus Kapabacteria bacterium]|jgi:multiple sugar transport system permease protein|nr:sugar ABC transporter permease [Candidatus Kapabacteria bacterium]
MNEGSSDIDETGAAGTSGRGPDSRAASRREASRRDRFRRVEPYLFVLPVTIGVVIVTGGAIAASFILGFTKWDLVTAPEWIGIANYREAFASDLFRQVLGNTFLYVLLSAPVSVACSLALALMVNRRIRGITAFRTLYFFPVVTSMVAVAVVWSWLYNPEFGLLNYLLRELGGIEGPRWLLSTDWAMPAIALMSIWKGIGYNMLIFLAGLQAIPETLYEAATIDGAGPVRRFTSVTLPMLSPTTFFVFVITLIGSFQIFEQTYTMTQGGPASSTLTLSYFIFQNAFQYFRMGYATAMAYILFAITLVVTIAQFRLQKRWVFYG